MRLLASLTLLVITSTTQAQMPSTDPVPKGVYSLDKAHASLTFRVSHLGFSTWTARFTRYDGKLEVDPARPAASSVEVTIDPRSISADNVPEGFLETLATDDKWLDANEYPDIKFVSNRVVPAGEALLVYGDLDENAMPALTVQLSAALIRANRDFDLLYLPNQNHEFFRNDAYYTRRMWDYFVEHLMGAKPPANYALQPPG